MSPKKPEPDKPVSAFEDFCRSDNVLDMIPFLIQMEKEIQEIHKEWEKEKQDVT